jgi:hypothetical protein
VQVERSLLQQRTTFKSPLLLLLQGFDEVLSALPPGSNMGNLLLELGQGMSAALGVLVSTPAAADASSTAFRCIA